MDGAFSNQRSAISQLIELKDFCWKLDADSW